MNILDKIITAINPRAGYERQAWREAMRFYDAGPGGRDKGWMPVNAAAQQTDRAARDLIRAKSRDLERNSDIGEAMVDAFERNVIGTGIRLQAKIKNEDGTENEALNTKIEELWRDWSRPRYCDTSGQQSFQEMQAMAIRRLLYDGGILFIKVYTGGKYSFRLQAKEVDELDTSIIKQKPDGGKIVDGIEFDPYGKPIAYYFRRYTVDGYYLGESERIPADRVIFLWEKKRPTQIREISPMARTLDRIRDMNEYMTAISVKERVLACLSVFIKKNNPGTFGRGVTIDKQSGYQERMLAPGMIQELNAGEDVVVVNPSGQASNAKDFIVTQQRLAGSGQGLSYEVVSRDMSQVNYSSARQGLLEDQKTYSKYQQFIIEHFCQEVYSSFLISIVLNGLIEIPDFWNQKEKYLRHEWITPGWSWIDPLKEVSANMNAVKNNFDTLSRICGERGLDWREVLEQRQKELEYMKKLGVDENGNHETGTGA